jgi:hypothetical protein
MTYQNLVKEIENLPLEDQLNLMEVLVRSIHRRTYPYAVLPQQQREEKASSASSLARVRGMLKPLTPMTDTELADAYTDYLIRKYV